MSLNIAIVKSSSQCTVKNFTTYCLDRLLYGYAMIRVFLWSFIIFSKAITLKNSYEELLL